MSTPSNGAPATPPRTRPTPEPSWIMPPPPGYPWAVGVIQIKVGKEAKRYFLREIASELGPGQRGFELSKIDPVPEGEEQFYNVLLDPRGLHTGDCKGWLRGGQERGPCRHIEGLLTLLALPVPSPPRPPPRSEVRHARVRAGVKDAAGQLRPPRPGHPGRRPGRGPGAGAPPRPSATGP